MGNIRIFTDSCSDLGGDIRAQYGIDYVKMCTVRAGKETPADLDWPTYTPKELYDVMRGGERIQTTQVPREEFLRGFGAALEEGDDVIYIGCALPLSSSVNTGTMAARELKEKYPDRRVTCINSINACLGEGMLAVFAAQLRNEGKGYDEIVEAVEAQKVFVNQFVTVGSLDMLKKAGRVKGSAAFFGNLLGVKPIIISDKNGLNVPIKKVKGRKPSLDELANLTVENIVAPEEQTLFIAHADCLEDAEYLRDQLTAKLQFKAVYVNFIGPIIGASIGPGAIAVFTFGKEITTAV